MPEPSLQILGVYKPTISEETYQEQWNVTESDEETKEHFDGLVLIEAVISTLSEPPKLEDIGQTHTIDGHEISQCAYDEALLSADGDVLIKREMDCVHGSGPLRFAFYLHFYDPNKPLDWTFGKVNCPPVEQAPERLMRLVPYTACS